MPLTIDMHTDIDAPIETVWQAISTQDGLRGWFSTTITFEAWVGGWVEFHGNHGDSPYRFGVRVVELRAPNLVTWEWNSMLEEWPATTLLSIVLEELDGKVRATMRHHGWEALGEPSSSEKHADFTRGWAMGNGLEDLRNYIEGIA